MADQRASNLVYAFSPTLKRQTTFGTALAQSEVTAAYPDYVEVAETIEQIKACSGQRIVDELVTGRIVTFTLNFDVTPQ